MRTILPFILLLIWQTSLSQNNVGIGTASPAASAALDVTSTTKGMLVPRMNSVQRGQIGSPATGLLVFDSDTESFWFKSSTNWVELIDTSNNVLKRSGNNIYTIGNTQVGIGTSSPLYDLHIKQQNANIGLQDAATNRISATFTASDSNVIMNAFRGGTAGGDIILQRGSSFPALAAGNVGIGVPFTSSPAEKLQVNGNLRLQHDDAKLALHNGTSEIGRLHVSNNDVRIGTSPGNTTGRLVFSTQGATHLALSSAGELQRPNVTGGSNLLPLAFGRIGSSGAIVSSTGNFTVQKGTTGIYKITLSGESGVYADRNSYVILLTGYNVNTLSTLTPIMEAGIAADNTIEVRISKPRIYWENNSCSQSCGPFSYITAFKFYDEVDNDFSILIYKH